VALLLRNARPYLLPLLRGSRLTSVIAGRTFSSGSNSVSLRSPAGLAPRNGDASEEGKLGEGITASFTGASPATVPHPNDIDSALCEETEDGEDGFDYEGANYGFINWRDSRMAQNITVTFLGTSSGGGPTQTRNCSSLVVDMLGDGTLWSACHPSSSTYIISPHQLIRASCM
jgi:hypothetical protein